MQDVGHQADGGRGVALRWFRQNLLFRDLGQLPDNLRLQMIVGENPDAFGRQHRLQAVHGLLDQRPFAHEAKHLFRVLAAAAGPEARTPPARQYEAVLIGFRHVT